MRILKIIMIMSFMGSVSCSGLDLTTDKDADKNTTTAKTEGPKVVEGGSCVADEHKNSSDGCNTCSCESGNWACTEMACVPKDVQCVDELPAALQKLINLAYAENQKQRDAAVAAERKRLDVSKLNVSEIVGQTENLKERFKPETDPYPNSVVALGVDYDIRKQGYEINHGKMDMIYVYETAAGSKQYFIIDSVGGDGVGGNGASVVAENAEYTSRSTQLAEEQNSYHSWHVRADNYIVRASQKPVDNFKEEVFICGCGDRLEVEDYRSDKNSAEMGFLPHSASGAFLDSSPPIYDVGVFLLPGSRKPEMGKEGSFEAQFERSYYKKTYVPKKGFICDAYDVVC